MTQLSISNIRCLPFLALGCAASLLMASTIARAQSNSPQRWKWSHPQPHGNHIVDMTIFQGSYVQATESGQIYTSLDLANWVHRRSPTLNALRAAATFNGKLILAGEEGLILWADSLYKFNEAALSEPTTDWFEDVAATDSLAVAVGDFGSIYTSQDGTFWRKHPQPFDDWMTAVAVNNGQFTAVGLDGFIATSADGVNWTPRASGTVENLFDVEWISVPNAAGFWAVGDNGTILFSADGVNWTANAGSGATGNLYTVSGSDDSILLAGASEVRLFQSSNSAWLDAANPALSFPAPSWTWLCSLWDGATFWIGGRSGVLVESFLSPDLNENVFLRSDDSPRNWMWDVARINDLYLTAGDVGTVLSSDNGFHWELEVTPNSLSDNVLLGIGGNPNGAVAVGSNGALIFSPNNEYEVVETNTVDGVSVVTTNVVSDLGIFWEEITPPTDQDLQGVAAFKNAYYISGGNGEIYSSPDGRQWTSRPTPTANFLSSLAASGDTLVCVGDGGTVLSSADGSQWQSQRADAGALWIYRVRYLANRFVATGENGLMLVSDDGVNWQRRQLDTSLFLNDATYSNGEWYVCGNQGTMFHSPDLINWTREPLITGKSLFGLSSNGNNQIVAVGTEGSILRKRVAPFNEPIEIVSFDHLINDDQSVTDFFLFSGEPDQPFQIEASSGLNDWQPEASLEIDDASGTLLHQIFPEDPAPRRFYKTKPLNE